MAVHRQTAASAVDGPVLVAATVARRTSQRTLADSSTVGPHAPLSDTLALSPTASVIVPVKNSQRTIRSTVEALLTQDYRALIEVIVVGDVGDNTWQALADVADPRLVIIEHEETPGKREPAIKRDVGLQKARGQVLALADSDIIMDPDWLSRSVALLVEQGISMVCGGMRAAEPTFWSRFVDGNVVAAKTPRVTRSYLVTAANFGKRGHKPPITANAVMDRSVYDDCPMDDNWGFGYEDYEWFWRVASAGHRVLYAAGLTGAHYHRQNFRALASEYRFSANGCVHFIRAFPDSPLARKRRRQAVLLPLAALAGVAGAAAVIGTGRGTISLVAAPVLAAGLVGREVFRARRLEGVGYAVAGVALGTLFVLTLGWRLARTSRVTRVFYHGRHS
jgi:glycosyltransferase involved in cell wall biosynthesis